MFVSRPEIRPYFYGGKLPSDEDNNKNTVIALASIGLDVIDAVLNLRARRIGCDVILGWREAFAVAFKGSPILCKSINGAWIEYGYARRAAREGCPAEWALPSS